MIGNDVVDLALAQKQSNWKRKGYLEKIFTSTEQEFIKKADNKTEMVWHLWSQKEAVYKILMQQGYKPGYYPKKIACLNVNSAVSKVQFDSTTYYVKNIISNSYVHSIAVLNLVDLNKIREIAWDDNCMKLNGIPFLLKNNTYQSISKSHHGAFVKVVSLEF